MIQYYLTKWGLGFLLSPAGKIVMALAALAGVYALGYYSRDCDAAQLRAQIAQMKEDSAEAEEIADAARGRADEAQERADELQVLVDEAVAAAGDDCPISDDLRERLREIR